MTVVTSLTVVPEPRFDHLLHLSDAHVRARRVHGAGPTATADMARVLLVVAREPTPGRPVAALGRTAMRFLVAAQGVLGRARNRRDADGDWHGRRGVEDCWGRSIAAFGTAANRGQDEWLRQMGILSFDHAVQQRSRWPRAMAFAALGAAEVLESDPRHHAARSLLGDVVETIGAPTGERRWPWPEPRLSYANATVAEALLAAGHALRRPDVVGHGCVLLGWLLDRESVDGHLSLTPVGGSGPEDVAPRFDQQPIEAAAMADACARAELVTGDPTWGRGVDLATGWFLGDNDAGAAMWDAETRGGYDGLHATGPNLNQGAESTIALISTLQHARSRRRVTP